MKKYALLAILMAMLLVTPAFAFWHPPPPPDERPPCTYFAALIEHEYTTSSDRYEFIEPEDSYCDTFIVEVGIFNVTDLYGYEFALSWNPTYFSLVSYTVEDTWPSQFVVLPDATYDMSTPYKQVVSAMAPSTGVSGDFLLATLEFHIDNDVCFLQGNVTGKFNLFDVKASNSCSEPIQLCTEMDGYWKFVPVKPKVWIDPPVEVNSKVGEKFTMTVWIENIVKMTDFDITVTWHGYQFSDEPGVWTALLCTTAEDVVINEEVFPADHSTQTITVNSPACSTRYAADPVGTVRVRVVMDADQDLINGTFWLFSITFEKCDPWFCGAQPEYEPLTDHDWDCENATTDITLSGYISVKCPAPDYMWLYGSIDVENAMFTFDPIPGDLDGNGHVDVTDIMIIAGYYAYELVEAWPGLPPKYITFYYDLNNDHVIDIYDIVIVAKNFCRTEP